MEGFLFKAVHGPDSIRSALDPVGFVLLAAFKQRLIEFDEGIHPGDRDEDVPSGPADKAFHESLFVAFRRVAEQGIEPVMSREVRIAFLLFGVGSETVFYGDFAIVKDHFGRRSVKDLKAADKSVQKAFFVLAVVCQDDRPAAVAQTGTKKIDLFSLALDIDKSFSPVDLKGFIRVKKEGRNTEGISCFSSCTFARTVDSPPVNPVSSTRRS